MGRKGLFWIKNDFIRKYAKELSVHAQIIYITLCCHANEQSITFIGCRKIGEILNINKNTVQKKIKELEEHKLVQRLDRMSGRPSHIKIFTVPYQESQPYVDVIPKDTFNKDKNKDKKIKYKQYFYGKWQELEVYKFPDGYKIIDCNGKSQEFGGSLSEIIKKS